MPAKLIKIKVFPRSKTPAVVLRAADALDVHVRAKPERNEANFEALTLVAGHFGVPLSSVRILHGRTQKNKLFQINS